MMREFLRKAKSVSGVARNSEAGAEQALTFLKDDMSCFQPVSSS